MHFIPTSCITYCTLFYRHEIPPQYHHHTVLLLLLLMYSINIGHLAFHHTHREIEREMKKYKQYVNVSCFLPLLILQRKHLFLSCFMLFAMNERNELAYYIRTRFSVSFKIDFLWFTPSGFPY